MTHKAETITLIGAGLNGPLLALGLVKRGFKVEIYERRADMRRVRMSAGRSINLALSTRGIHALTQAGLWEPMQKIIVPMKGRMMHSAASETTFQPYGKNESEVINSISRAELNIALMDAAEAQGVAIHFHKRCAGIDLKTGLLRLRDEETGEERMVETEVVIGCDGSASAIRGEMLKRSRFNFSQQYLDYGYKELTIPTGPDGKHVLETNALHIWPRGNYMLIALPNVDGTFACILFLPFEGPDSFERLTTQPEVIEFFRSRFPDAVPVMPDLTDNFFANPTGAMMTIKCSPWHLEGRALLLGDAAHAIVPFFGQGINCGFEDCTILLELLDLHGADWSRVFREFEESRKVNTDAIADMAVENFVEMRDRVADPRFLLRKKIEFALEAKYPRRFVPKYAMVTFHRVPYATALNRGQVQDRMLTEICDGIEGVEDLDWNKADRLIQSELTPLELN
ncbi:MAG TPA: NAD(P)/FAD-dependent oxidoreductase [Candidatus Dormibacteraeota bacterium]|nr:NAD(P)/FAD-dependent oxidoreductase [Candidatus Dormibacteraeota bacterium]